MIPDGRIVVRNSKHPDAGAVLFTRAEMDSWIKASRPARSTTSPGRPGDLPEVTATVAVGRMAGHRSGRRSDAVLISRTRRTREGGQ
ncbi:MAG: DUF397 domain-containing protein [Pseudonocardiaceae bacterium]